MKGITITILMEIQNVIGVCGSHNSGKTTLIVEVIKRLKKDGYKVATIKSIPREFSIDKKGKDTWKHGDAGADAVVALSENETALILKRGMKLERVLEILNEVIEPDLILLEGKKKERRIPKIVVGDLNVDGAFRYDGNFEELIDWIKSLLVSSDRSSPYG
ncbi:MAG: molybdopterin-guanine dinucleotide biosynthesis protein B [Candidatus Syntropharchaeales archaeon]